MSLLSTGLVSLIPWSKPWSERTKCQKRESIIKLSELALGSQTRSRVIHRSIYLTAQTTCFCKVMRKLKRALSSCRRKWRSWECMELMMLSRCSELKLLRSIYGGGWRFGIMEGFIWMPKWLSCKTWTLGWTLKTMSSWCALLLTCTLTMDLWRWPSIIHLDWWWPKLLSIKLRIDITWTKNSPT